MACLTYSISRNDLYLAQSGWDGSATVLCMLPVLTSGAARVTICRPSTPKHKQQGAAAAASAAGCRAARSTEPLQRAQRRKEQAQRRKRNVGKIMQDEDVCMCLLYSLLHLV